MSPTLARQPRNSTSSCLNHQARQITVPSVASANEFRPIFYFRVSRSVGGLNYSISTHGCTESIISQKNGYIGTLIRLCVLYGQAICLNILVFRMVYVRQGGILSPYMDDLTIALSICDTGCVIGYSNINTGCVIGYSNINTGCVIGYSNINTGCVIGYSNINTGCVMVTQTLIQDVL